MRTSGRIDPGAGRAYPLGAQLVSRCLAGVPQYDHLRLVFFAGTIGTIGVHVPGWHDRYLRGAVGKQLAEFNKLLSCGWHLGEWSLWFYPVPKTEKKLIRGLHQTFALPRVRDWLSEPRSDTWFEGQHVLEAGLRREPLELGFLETHNNSVVHLSRLAVRER
jgi:hypothetical protein